MGFSRQEYCSGLPCLPPGDLSNPGMERRPLMSPALAGGSFTTSTNWESVHSRERSRMTQQRSRVLPLGPKAAKRNQYLKKKKVWAWAIESSHFERLLLPQTRTTKAPFPGHSTTGSPQPLTAPSLQLHKAASLSSFAASLQVRIPWGACGCSSHHYIRIPERWWASCWYPSRVRMPWAATYGRQCRQVTILVPLLCRDPTGRITKGCTSRKAMTNVHGILKSRDTTLPTKVRPVKAMLFPSGHVWMWELDCEEGWAPKNWCFQTVVLKTLESPLDCKEIQPVHPKGNQSWIFIRRTDAEAESPIPWPPDVKSSHWKRPWCWGRLKARGEGDDRGWDGWMASLTQWAWVWVDSGSWWWTGRPGVPWSMGSLIVRHEWATELNWTELQGTRES